jgi:aryl-alcohol dehydrogenase-like predicted oxidoreductase
MEKRAFGNTGLEVTPLGFGGAPIGMLDTEESRTDKILNLLLDSGVNLIDTAASYHGSEEMIGKTIGHRRDEFILVSKCGGKFDEFDDPAWSPSIITKTIDRSLQRLKTDRLDVMLLHTCDLETLKKGDALAALVKARDAGKIRFSGYSGDNETVAYAATLDDVKVIQTSINITDQVNIDGLLPGARENNIGVMVKRPIANAAWKTLSDQPGMYKDYAKTYTERLQKMNLNPADLGYDGPPESVWPEIALRFTISQPGVHVAIIGTTNPDNARTNIAVAEKGPLPDEIVTKIRDAFKSANSDGSWVAQG